MMCAEIRHNDLFTVLLFTKPVYRGLGFLCPHVELHNFIFWYDVGLVLIVCGDVFSLWCFPCLYLWSAFTGEATPGSMKHSEIKHLFCLAGGVSSTSSPCRVLVTTAGRLGALDQSGTSLVYSSLVSHSVSLSKFSDVDHSDLALVHASSTIGSTREDGAGFGPTNATDRQGQKFPRSLVDRDSTSVSDEGTPLITIDPAPFIWGS